MTKETVIILLILAALAWSCSVLAEPFVSVGLGVHDAATAAPEINLSVPLGILETGYEYHNFQLKFTHISGLATREQGYGLNMISINYVWRIK